MKIIITENQNYVLRRLQQFIDIVESEIDEFEKNNQSPWWCNGLNSSDILVREVCELSIEEFINYNWDFFHDDSERGGSNMDITMLNKIVEENYGNYIRNLWVRKCGLQHQ